MSASDPSTSKSPSLPATNVAEETNRFLHAVGDADTLLRRLIGASRDCIKILDLKGNLLAMNPNGQAILGISDLQPLLGGCWTHWWEGEARDKAAHAVKEAVAGRPGRFEASTTTPNGKFGWWEVIITAIAAEDGTPSRLLAVSRDVTERRQAEDELKSARRRLDSALSAAEMGTFEWDIVADRLYGDANFEHLFDIHLDPDSGLPLSRFINAIHPDDRSMVTSRIEHTVATGAPYETEYRITTRKGERWVIARGRIERDAGGRPVRFPGVLVDITARKLAESARQAAADETLRQARVYNDVLSATDDFAYIFNRQGQFIYANRRLLQVWGVSLSEAVGKTCLDLGYPKWHHDMHMREIAQVITTREPIRGEVPFTGGSGISGVYDYIFTPVLGPDGEVELIAGTTRDVSERKRVERRDRLLIALDDGTRSLTNSQDITHASARLIGEHLNVNRCAYADVEEDQNTFNLTGDYNSSVPSIVGRYTFDQFGLECLRLMRAGEPYVVVDSETDPRCAKTLDAYRATQIRAVICVPVMKGTRFVAAMAVHQLQPRKWEESEVMLLQRLVNRCWESIERSRVTRRLQASESRYRRLIETVSSAVWLTDSAGKMAVENPSWSHFTGQTWEQYRGWGWLDAIHPDDRDPTRQVWEASLEAKTPYEAHYRLMRSDGVYRHVLARGAPVNVAEGAASEWVGNCADITDRILSEMQVRRSEAAFRQLADAMPQIVFSSTPDGHVDYFNGKWYEYTGATDGAVGIENWSHVHEPHRLPEITARWMASVESGADYEIEYMLRRADGMFRWHLGRALAARDEQGKIIRWFGTNTDIHDWKIAEAAVRESEARFRHMSDGAPVMIWVTRADGHCEYLNRQWYEFTGQTVDVALGLGWLTAVHPDDSQRSADTFLTANERHESFRLEYRLLRHDGEYRWCVDSGTPRFGDAGEFLGYIGTVVDITDRAIAEQERTALLDAERMARVDAERQSRMKDEFLATLSHELRTPLNAILGWSQIMNRGLADKEDLAQGLEVIERNARAQAQIIEDLLDMSRIISGKVRLDVQRLDLSSIVQTAVETARPTANAKGVRLQSVIDPLLGVAVSGDANRLQQVLWNLLSNAIKFTPRGGRVQVLLERINSHLEISVIDSGEGIKAEFLPYVFDRFRQADASTTRRHGGLGLGLSIVKQLVELHGGSIAARSVGEGQGSTFVVILPLTVLHPESPTPAERRHPRTSPDLASFPDACLDVAGLRVLVVDDEPDARALVSRLLTDCEAKVMTASSAAEALDMLAQHEFDVLVSDIGMPGEDGHSLIRRLRSSGQKQAGIPAIALTAYARAEDRVRAIAAGFQMHVAKPVEPVELITMVAGAAGRAARG